MPIKFGSLAIFAVTLAVILAVAVIAAVILAVILAVIFAFVRTQLLRRLHRPYRLYRLHGFHRLHRGDRVFPETGQRARLNVAIFDAPSDLFCPQARFISLAYGSLHPPCDPARGLVRPTHGFPCPTLLISYAHVSSFSPPKEDGVYGHLTI